MPIPLKPNEPIYIERKLMPTAYTMPSMQVALDHYSIVYIISGDRKTRTPNQSYSYHTGDMTTTAPMNYCQTTALSDLPYERILIKFSEEMITPIIDCVGKPQFETFINQRVHHFAPSIQLKLFKICLDMLEEFESHASFSMLILQGMLHRLILTMMRFQISYNEDSLPSNTGCNHIIQALSYIEMHYKENPSLETVAAYVFLSPTYFSKLFKKHVGSTYSLYLNHVKLQYAQQLLLQSSLSIGAIAEEVGFVNGNYFCDVFKKHVGMSPTQFRNLSTHPVAIHPTQTKNT